MKISDLRNTDPRHITNIVFDWGGVITHINFDIAVKKFREMGFNGFAKRVGSYPHNEMMLKFETGQIAPEEILHFLKQETIADVSEDDIWNAWNSILLDTPAANIEVLKNLRKKFNLSLLSNTNIVHVTYYRNFLRQKYNIDFFTLFDQVFLSYELGLRKPDPKIFNYVLSKNGFSAGETLFIDDLRSNIEAADSCGYVSLLLEKNILLDKLFEPWAE
jgi:putative hydrolase of the HAD superfamily